MSGLFKAQPKCSRCGARRSWVYKLKARYEAEGHAALEPRSRRPKTSPGATAPHVVELIVALLQRAGRRRPRCRTRHHLLAP